MADSPGTDRIAAFLAARLAEDEAAAETWRRRDLRPLRETAAKRAILAEHRQAGTWCHRCDPAADMDDQHAYYPCLAVRALASIYADHPDYDPSWSPATP